ncbi:alpha/beta fold hydrolase [Blastococcus capsensis]|uniref:alpha/beta fold hydrolase n=1 Tax=Blastococcus capsensis TaxID=1564163 RepID=UPI0025416B89|nr:alpha/beta fold hydrolase [Blastococcus capsensis]MDK3256639.1 alpha/beta fold hydrolase [Blastococcus capsensis]
MTAWTSGGGHELTAGPLHVRTMGSGQSVVLLLHGMAGAGNSFGAVYDRLAEQATVVIPDLLGFGRSMDITAPTDAGVHLAVLDDALAGLGLQDRPTVVAGYSMGGLLALRWAAEHRDTVRSVVTFAAPLYRSRAEADAHVAGLGRLESLLAGDGRLPRAACAWMCRHRTAASWMAVAYRPDLPIPVARSGVEHTWSSYSASMNGLIRDAGWVDALEHLRRAQIPVTLALGACDPALVPGRATELARTRPSVTSVVHPMADHGLPLSHPEWCQRLVAAALLDTHPTAPPERWSDRVT